MKTVTDRTGATSNTFARMRQFRSMSMATAVAILVTVGPASAADEPLVSEATSKVLGTVAHVILGLTVGSTVDRIVAPWVDEALAHYLRGNPTAIQPALKAEEAKLSQKLSDGAEQDIPVLKAQLELVQKELAALKAAQQAAPDHPATAEVSATLSTGVAQMGDKIAGRDAELAKVEQKLTTVSVQLDSVKQGAPTPPPAAASAKPDWCANATTQLEHAICNDPTLTESDLQLEAAYVALRRFFPPSQSIELRNEQRAWIGHRNKLLTSTCLVDGKLDTHCAIPYWKTRITQLEGRLEDAKTRKL